MLVALVIAIAVVTYLSRVGALVLLPAPRGWLSDVVARVPAPLFAALAVAILLDGDRALPPLPTLAAVAAAVVVSPRRSLGLTLLAGLIAYGAASLLLSSVTT